MSPRRFTDEQGVFVGNIPHDITENQLRNLFSNYGNIVDLKLNRNHKRGKALNYGFVIFNDPSIVKKVLSMRPICIGIHCLRVVEIRSQTNRPRATWSDNGDTNGSNSWGFWEADEVQSMNNLDSSGSQNQSETFEDRGDQEDGAVDQVQLTICTYPGDFHCDQIFACYLLRKLGGLGAKIVRTLDSSLIEESDCVIGFGLVYDHFRGLYDYHQSSFKDTTLKCLDPRKPFTIKLSCAGLVYHHYGRRVIKKILNLTSDYQLLSKFDDDELIETIFDAIYENFVSEIDAIANDTSFNKGKSAFKINTDLTSRVSRLRPNWTDQINDHLQTERFMEAIDLVGSEFEEIVKYYCKVWLPARILVKKAFLNCKKVQSSGEIIDLSQLGESPWIEHLINIEKELNIEGKIKFAIFYDVSGTWRLSCVPRTYSLDELRIPFHPDWHGLSYSAFCEITGIPDCIYIHPLISDFETRESCIAVAEKLIQLNSDRNLNKAKSISDESFYSITDQLSSMGINVQINGHKPTINGNLKKDDRSDNETKMRRLSSLEEIPDDWDPMAEDAKCYSNNYQYDPTDIGNVVQGFKTKDYTGICHHFLRGQCKYGAGCVHKHVTSHELQLLDKEEVLLETLERNIVKEGLKLNVTVTSCRSPYSFYVVPAEDIIHQQSFDSRVGRNYNFIDPTQKNLLILLGEMAEFYRKPENTENMIVFPAIGSLIAVRAELFYRARVIDMSLDEDDLTVMNIDTGVELIVERRDVFTLKPKFATLPAFAVHCAMEVPSGFCVTDEVMSNFSELVLGQTFKAHFKERDMAGRFRVDLFHSEGQKVII